MRTIVMVVAMAIFLCGGSSNGRVSLVSADPIGPPNLSDCRPPDNECCLPRPSNLSTFSPLNVSTAPRIRRALQSVLQDPQYLARLSAAYTELRRLQRDNPADPRGLGHQRRLHCAFCSQLVYGPEYNMHGNWFFLPWHRMLLYYHERILAWATGDASFALPFWNWDSDAEKALPSPYANTSSSLYNPGRSGAGDIRSCVQQSTLGRDLFRDFGDVKAWETVMGTAATPGSLETTGHNAVHTCVGGDMVDVFSAANDPVFYPHHANVDRMWSVWRQLPNTSDPTSADFRNSRFVFYDENATARIIAVSDVLDHRTNLRYVYENVNDAWTTPPPGTGRTIALNDVTRLLPPLKDPLTFEATVTVSAADGNVATAFVQSPQAIVRRGALPELTLSDVAHSRAEPLALYVFINQPDADANTPRAGNPNYVGARFLMAGGMSMPVSLTLPLRICLAELKLSLSRNFTVQVVRGTQFGAPKRAWSIDAIDYVHDPPV